MPRPSRHLDRALLAAGRELYPALGCAGLTIRQVAEAAEVNIGMFHYHFRTREAFLRAMMQGAYEEMFSSLTLAARPDVTFRNALRAALRVLGGFLLDNRPLVARILADALSGEAVARDFLRDNLPRHVRVILGLVQAAQAAGELRSVAPVQALGFCAGAVALPILGGGLAADELDAAAARPLRENLLTPEALEERIDLALAALAPVGAPAPSPGGIR